MNRSNTLIAPEKAETPSFYEESSFKLVSNLLTEELGRKCQSITVTSKSGNFIHDQTVGVEYTETSHLLIHGANVIERERVTEILIDGSVRKRNGTNNKFSIFFTMYRQFLVIPKPFKERENRTTKTIKSSQLLGFGGMLYNSIFTLSLNCADKSGCQYPLGVGRGYLIFDEEQRE
ncbi:hypothetical protein [Desulforhopalus sp. 52FAK]